MTLLVLITKNTNKYCEIKKNTSKKEIVINWGNVGGNFYTKVIPYSNEDYAEEFINELIKNKKARGYTDECFTKVEKKANATLKAKKECPEGKVLNLKTNRCVKAPVLKVVNEKKECPEGKVLNLKTNRCNKAPVLKTPKKTIKFKVKKTSKSVKKNSVVASNNKPNMPITTQTQSKPVYDVAKEGVLLAHTYKDPHSGKVKNPPKGFPKAPKGWYASEKYDGYRAVWDGHDFRSRTGKIFVAPDWFKAWLPSNMAFDGELFMGRECFEKCGIFRRKVPDDKEWRSSDITYQIFDLPSSKEPFEMRQKTIEKFVKSQCKKKMPKEMGACPLRLTKQKLVQTEEDVFNMFDSLVSKGAEGVMLRCPGSLYEPKRSSTLLKVKPFFDAECRITGYKEGTGKYSGKLGAFQCETLKKPNVKFYISGMNDEVRDNYKTSHPVGTIVTYTYIGINESGVPRHPNYLRKRQTE